MAAFCCLYFNKSVRLSAICFLAGWFVYLCFYFYEILHDSWYYIFSAIIETAIAYALNKRFRLVSYLGYSLIFINLYGYYLFYNGLSPISYDIIYAVITITQVLLLIFRGLLNGVNRSCNHIAVVRFINFDSRYKNREVQNAKKTKEAY